MAAGRWRLGVLFSCPSPRLYTRRLLLAPEGKWPNSVVVSSGGSCLEESALARPSLPACSSQVARIPDRSVLPKPFLRNSFAPPWNRHGKGGGNLLCRERFPPEGGFESRAAFYTSLRQLIQEIGRQDPHPPVWRWSSSGASKRACSRSVFQLEPICAIRLPRN